MKVGWGMKQATRFSSITILSHAEALKLSLNQVTLNAINHIVCFDVMLSADETPIDIANFTIQLLRTVNQNYDIEFRQQFILIDILKR